MILARDQVIRHSFTLKNDGTAPVRLTRATALTPCCSAIESFAPGVVASGGSAMVEVSFRPGHQAGGKRVAFLVEAEPESSAIQLALVAELIGEWETNWLAGSGGILPANRPGTQRLQVVCRRLGNEGRGAPDAVAASSGLKAEFLGPPVTRRLDAVEEATRDVLVSLPGSATPGAHLGELTFRWDDSKTITERVAWAVTLPITSAPAAFVLEPRQDAPVRRMVVLRSADRPFRVTAATGPLVAGSFVPPSEPARVHHIELAIDPGQVAGAADIRLTTDHPDQPEVPLSVLALAARAEEPRP